MKDFLSAGWKKNKIKASGFCTGWTSAYYIYNYLPENDNIYLNLLKARFTAIIQGVPEFNVHPKHGIDRNYHEQNYKKKYVVCKLLYYAKIFIFFL